MKLQLARLLPLVLPALLVACGSAPVVPTPTTTTTMTYDHQFNFSSVRKVYIQPTSRTDVATIAISDTQISRIDNALGVELQRLGFETVSSSREADLFLTWYLITEDLIKSGNCDGCDPALAGGHRYAHGTLIVNMVDPLRNQAVWRSVLKTSLAGDPGSASAEASRQQAAADIFAGFPPQ
jgi:hypothetical protein